MIFFPSPIVVPPTSLAVTLWSKPCQKKKKTTSSALADFNFAQGTYLVFENGRVYEWYTKDRKSEPPTKRVFNKGRLFLPSDSFIDVENSSRSSIVLKRSSGAVSESITLAPGKRTRILGQQMLVEVFEQATTPSNESGQVPVTRFSVAVAQDLTIVTQVGTAALFTIGKLSRYSIVSEQTGAVDGENSPVTKNVIRKTPLPQITSGITGQVYLFFSDDFGLSAPTAANFLAFNSYNPAYHRLGIVAGLSTDQESDTAYQLGIAWALDPKARFVLSYGFLFRNRERLRGLKTGDEFGGTSLPVSKTFIGVPFFGISFNFGT